VSSPPPETRLFEPCRHESLSRVPWEPEAARRSVAEIVAHTLDALEDSTFWPTHPRDDDYLGGRRQTTVYAGAAGVLFALHALRRRGFEIGLDLRDVAWRVHRHWRRDPDAGFVPSLLLGESGLLLLLAELGETERVASRLESLVVANREHPARELMWGAPGTLWAACRMAELTCDEKWWSLYGDGARCLRAAAEGGAALWTHSLYGERVPFLGACHGGAGAHQALLAGRHALERAEAAQVVKAAVAFAKGTARRSHGLANWPTTGSSGDEDWLVQWCHGAPGVIISLQGVPVGADPDFERLLLEAGELIWRAGPLVKGRSLCHGAAGNGYAFLALYERTGADVWLERARSFAAHALGQLRAAWADHGRPRFTLFTGDLGTAAFLADCLAGGGRFPVVGSAPAADG
jgi:hypothetical protein